nr:CorA family divalent cation transporter [Streptococcus oralis]
MNLDLEQLPDFKVLSEIYGIDQKTIKYALDRNERAHMDYHRESLTIISVLLAILAVITGFFGMNVPLPFVDKPNAWIYILLASLILWVVLAQYLKNIARN